jgi:NAD(P)H-hydrate epimerase
VNQCEKMNIPFLACLPLDTKTLDTNYILVIDAIFGFRFDGEIRPPFVAILDKLKSLKVPICSLDVPSGWDADKGGKNSNDLKPEMLISLTAPKVCARNFRGKYHYLAGRFIPQPLQEKFKLLLPQYIDSEPCVELRIF